MNNKNKKGYKKVYLNGECLIDFTKQTIDENKVASGNMFFNSEGKLVEGQDDSLKILLSYVDYDYSSNPEPIFKTSVNFGNINKITYYYSSNMYYGFPCANYWVLPTTFSSIEPQNDYYYLGGFYIPHLSSISSNLIVDLSKAVTSTQGRPGLMAYCEDDFSQYIKDDLKDQFVFNCSGIRKTSDEFFDYTISNNKVYILNVNYQKLLSEPNSWLIYSDLTSAYTLKFPSIIENKPVVCLTGSIFPDNFSYTISSYFNFSGSFEEIQLPENLEILGGGCFSYMYVADRLKVKLPDTLRAVFGSDDGYYAPFSSTSPLDLSPNMIDNKFYLPSALKNISGVTLDTLLYNVELPENECFIAKQDNPYAVYVHNSDSSDVVIPEGSEFAIHIPQSVTSITFPSTICSLPRLEYCQNLTALNFASSIQATKIPSSFCMNSSNSNFTTLVVPEGIEEIGYQAFWYCVLNNITLPTTLKRIDGFGFYDGKSSGAISKTFKIKAATPPSLYGTNSLTYSNNNIAKIIVPKGCLDTYKKASVWSNWASKMEESTEW